MYVIYNIYTAVQAEVHDQFVFMGAPKPVGCMIRSETWQHTLFLLIKKSVLKRNLYDLSLTHEEVSN